MRKTFPRRSTIGRLLPFTDSRFLCDVTGLDAHGARQSEQQIFDELFAMINRAERLWDRHVPVQRLSGGRPARIVVVRRVTKT